MDPLEKENEMLMLYYKTTVCVKCPNQDRTPGGYPVMKCENYPN